MIGVGTEVDGFVIEGVAGRGGMGVVYRARQRRPERVVALKVIAAGLADDPQFAARFRRESSIAAQIEHPNVIPVHAVGEADGVLYIAMRFVVGTDLHALLARERRLEPRRAAGIADQVAQALDAAHVHGLVHRDVKPANILIAAAGGREHVYLSDFGLSRHVEGSQALTDSGAFVGTVDYVSPEQARGERVDARSDVYSLGCVLFEALTGTVPFPLDNNLAKLYAHDSKPPPSVLERAADVPAAFEGVLARAMAKSADDRYPSAGDLGRAATAAVSGESPAAVERSVAVGEAAPQAPTLTTQRSVADATPVGAAPGAPTKATATRRPQAPAETSPGAERPIARAPHRRRVLAGALAVAVAVAVAAGVVVVLAQGDGHGAATLRVPSQYRTIQAALNAAKPGQTVAVAAGSFTQQLTIRKRVTLTGTGTDSTTISAPASLAPGPLASLRSIVTVVGGAHVAISHLKVAGPRTSSCASPSDLNVGILVGQNATLDLRSAAVTRIRDVPAGCIGSPPRAIAVTIGVSATAPSRNPKGAVPAGGYASAGHAIIKADLISGYGEEGIDVAGSGSTATIIASHISGVGSSSARVVDGINVRLGGTATIVGNTITGNQCTSPRAAALARGGRPCGPNPLHQAHDMGLLVALTGPGTIITDNRLSGNDVGMQLVKAPSCCTDSHNTLVDNRFFGDILWDVRAGSVNGDTISGGRVGVGVVAQGNNTAVALHGVSIRHTAVAPTRTYSCCGHHATVLH